MTVRKTGSRIHVLKPYQLLYCFHMTEQEMGLSTVRNCSNCWNPDLSYSILGKTVFSQTMAWLRNSILSGFYDILRIEDDFASNWTCRQYYLSGPTHKTDYGKGYHPTRNWELKELMNILIPSQKPFLRTPRVARLRKYAYVTKSISRVLRGAILFQQAWTVLGDSLTNIDTSPYLGVTCQLTSAWK